jgi:hypothetical protein
MRISTNGTQAKKVGNPDENVKTVKEPKKILCDEIEPNPSKDRAILKQVPKYLATGL